MLHPYVGNRDEAFFVWEAATMKIIYKDGTVAECPQDQELHVLRHTAAHIMAQAIKRLYPEADFAFGPARERLLLRR